MATSIKTSEELFAFEAMVQQMHEKVNFLSMNWSEINLDSEYEYEQLPIIEIYIKACSPEEYRKVAIDLTPKTYDKIKNDVVFICSNKEITRQE